jgi:hypothetical protein
VRRGSVAIVLGALIVANIAGGVAAAANPKTSTVTGCVSSKGLLGVPARSGRCARGYTKTSLNRRGPRGQTGPRGTTGPKGATGSPGPAAPAGALRRLFGTDYGHPIPRTDDPTTAYQQLLALADINPGTYLVQFQVGIEDLDTAPNVPVYCRVSQDEIANSDKIDDIDDVVESQTPDVQTTTDAGTVDHPGETEMTGSVVVTVDVVSQFNFGCASAGPQTSLDPRASYTFTATELDITAGQ